MKKMANFSILPFNKLLNLENRVFFIEKYLKLSYKEDELSKSSNKPIKIFVESKLFSESIHHGDLNHILFKKYLDDPHHDVYFIRIYIHKLETIHQETVVTVHDNYYAHYFVRKFYSVYILARHSLIPIDNKEEEIDSLLNTDSSKTSNIIRYLDKGKRVLLFFGYCME